MNLDLVTKDDLAAFSVDLIREIKSVLSTALKGQTAAQWLRGYEVKKLLKVSTGTIQNLRINGQLHPSKIGGLLYYKKTEIGLLLNQNV